MSGTFLSYSFPCRCPWRTASWPNGRFKSKMLDGFLDPRVASKRCPSNHAIANSLKFARHLRLVNSLNPVVWSRQWPFTQQLALGRRSIVTVPETTPTPILRPLHQIGSQSIAFNVSTHGKIMFIRLNHKRLEPPLVYMPASCRMAVGMPMLGVGLK